MVINLIAGFCVYMKKKRPSPSDDKLNPMELAFCYEYIANKFNGLKAATAAGYSEKTAGVQASRLLNRVNVRAKIKELTDRHLNKLTITAEKVLLELAKMGFSDLKNHVKFDGKKFDIKSFDDMGINTAAIKEFSYQEDFVKNEGGEETPIGTRDVKFKLHEKKGALELLGKNMGLFNGDNGENEDPPGTTYNYTYDD